MLYSFYDGLAQFMTGWRMPVDYIHKQLVPHCVSLVRVRVLMYIVKRRAGKINEECILVQMFKRSEGNVCMSFGFWFWQFDRSGAADRVYGH